jgi:PAS domain S-box-containing protein
METENIALNTELFTAILNFVPAGISVATDASCKEIVHNPAAAEFLRIRPWDRLSHSSANPPALKLYYEGRELAPEEMPVQLAAWRGLEVRDFEMEFIWDDGVHKTSLWNASPMKDDQGNITGAVATFKDITEQRRADKRIQHQNELLEGINRILREALTCDTEEELGRTCLEVAEELTRSKIGFIGELDPDGQLYDIAISNPGWDACRMEDQTGHRKPPTEFRIHGIYGRVLRDGKPFFTNDPSSHPDSIGLPEGHPTLTAFLGAPLVHEGKTIGIFGLGNREGGYRPENLEDIEALSHSIVQVLMRKRAEEEIRRLNEELEQRVIERTEELTKSNEKLNVLNEEMSVINEELTDNSRQLEEEIERRKASELELQAASQKVTNILESISDGFIALDQEWRYTYLNAEALRQLGIQDESELIGKVIWDAFPDLNKTANELYHQAVSEHTPVRLEIYSQVTGRWLDIHAYPSTDSLSVYFLDITERKKAEEALRLSEERFAKAFHSGPTIGAIRSLNDNRIIDVNDNFVKVLEYEREEVIGHTSMELGYWVDREVFEQVIRELKSKDELKDVEVDLRTKSGKIIRVLFSAFTTEIDGKPCTLVNFVDITERKRMEEDLSHRAEELAKTNKELESFSYTISHDLRAPLRAINGFSQLIFNEYQDKLDDEGKEYLKIVRSECNRMGKLIDGILQLSRLSRKELKREKLDLSAIAETIAVEFRKIEPERQVDFAITPGIRAYGDRVLLQSVLQNLLDNAWKFTSKHPKTRIEFGVTEQEGKKVYFVRDDGAGFDMRYVDKLFGTFQRIHGVDEFPGNGVGLAIIQRIIHHHGGQVRAEGAVEKGATFYFTLD